MGAIPLSADIQPNLTGALPLRIPKLQELQIGSAIRCSAQTGRALKWHGRCYKDVRAGAFQPGLRNGQNTLLLISANWGNSRNLNRRIADTERGNLDVSLESIRVFQRASKCRVEFSLTVKPVICPRKK